MTTVDPIPSNSTTTNAPFVPTAASALGFARCRPEIEAAARGELVALNLDIPQVVRVMLTVCGNVAPYRAELASLGADVAERLESRAQALSYAHALHAWSLESPPAIEKLATQVLEARRVLTSELELVELRGLIAKGALKLQGTVGHLAMAQDVRAITSAFLANWQLIGPQIGGDIEHVNAAMVAADQLIAAIAMAEQLQEKMKGTALQRAAAWTIALRTYRELDRAISYIRYFEGDAAEIVPSLFERGPRKKAKEEPVVQPGAATPAPIAGAGSSAPVAVEQPNIPSTPIKPTIPFAG